MSDLLKKLNEMEARHSMEIKELREVIEKEVVSQEEPIFGEMFSISTIDICFQLIDRSGDSLTLTMRQVDQLRAIENILQTAHKRTPGNMELYDAFKEAEKLGLKF